MKKLKKLAKENQVNFSIFNTTKALFSYVFINKKSNIMFAKK